MRKIKLYIAISLDGKIAKPNGDVSWLDEVLNPDKADYGYEEFIDSIDATLMGRKTFIQVEAFEGPFPYRDLKNYVFTKHPEKYASENIEFVSEEIISFIQDLKSKPGKDIWLIGGGQINALLLNHQLIDEMLIFVMPIVLGAGIPLFHSLASEKALNLVEIKSYSSGVVLMKYESIPYK